ncbi:hypothetical protein ACVGVM_17315 [Pseudonocardia bannensis]|uniref:Uncharacterized protein n=1 Tax=Pseudonocardia bannensis TaxID=630973 RepID=A0A848DLL7_9PSEU|nr:hypothetical protein [Pseudonocardia bannensis]NMH93647.1 hypothetical protein [Pseudonocardia bannensis]
MAGIGPAAAAPTAPADRAERNWRRAATWSVNTTAALHVVVGLDHLHHSTLLAAFFFGVALVQAGLGEGLRRRGPQGTLAAGVGGTVALVVLYVVSRLATLPLHEFNDRPEATDLLGMSVVTLELITVAALAALAAERWRARILDGVLLVGLGVWAAWATGILS